MAASQATNVKCDVPWLHDGLGWIAGCAGKVDKKAGSYPGLGCCSLFMGWSASRAESQLPHAPIVKPHQKSNGLSRGCLGSDDAFPDNHPVLGEWLQPWFEYGA